MLDALLVLIVDGLCGSLGETLSVEIFTRDLRNVTSIAGNVLRFDVLGWTSNPVFSREGMISVLNLIELGVLDGRVDMVISLLISWLANRNIDVVLGWFLLLACEQVVDVARSAAVDLIFLGDVTRIARQILFVVFDECFGTHF